MISREAVPLSELLDEQTRTIIPVWYIGVRLPSQVIAGSVLGYDQQIDPNNASNITVEPRYLNFQDFINTMRHYRLDKEGGSTSNLFLTTFNESVVKMDAANFPSTVLGYLPQASALLPYFYPTYEDWSLHLQQFYERTKILRECNNPAVALLYLDDQERWIASRIAENNVFNFDKSAWREVFL